MRWRKRARIHSYGPHGWQYGPSSAASAWYLTVNGRNTAFTPSARPSGARGFLRGALCAVLAIQHCRRVSHFAATRYSHRRCCSRQQLFGNEAFSCGGDEELTWCQAPNKAYLDSSVKLSAWQERHHLTHRSLNCDTNAKGNGA